MYKVFSSRSAPALLLALGLLACSDNGNPLGPDGKYVKLVVLSGDRQFAAPNAKLADSLRVHVSFLLDGFAANRALVHWRVLSGSNAVISPEESRTDETGVASTSVVLGGLGDYEIEATITGSTVRTARFHARAVQTPIIENVAPAQAKPGDTLRITGKNFSTTATDNTVLFDGVQGGILSATSTELRAIVPECIPARQVKLVTALGAIASAASNVQITSNPNNLLKLNVGQVAMLPRSGTQSCVQLPGDPNAQYLVVTQNVSRQWAGFMPFQLVGLAQGSTPLAPRIAAPVLPLMENEAMTGVALEFEARMRARERKFNARDAIINQPTELMAARASASLSQMEPQLGDHKRFTVQNKDGAYVTLDAEVKAISRHAVVYQELGVPSTGFSDDDYLTFVKFVEDPVFDTDTRVFGALSDIDADGRMAIVLTSVVNRMTDPSAQGFIAGFFDACDLMIRAACPFSNRGEVFYTIMPDPDGVYGKKHPAADLLHRIPPVIAHELMHMIHYNQRVTGLRAQEDESWVKEMLAHMAEDTVAGVLLERNDPRAVDFLAANYIRAYRYLTNPASSSLIYLDEGTLEERGAGWLLLRYLLGHVSGEMLKQLTRSSLIGIANLEAVTRKSWENMLSEWSVALWADNAPELGQTLVESRYTYPNMNLRDALGTSQTAPPFNGTYALRPATMGFVDFLSTGVLPTGSQSYTLVSAGVTAEPLIVNLTGPRGSILPASSRAQFSILRVR